MPAEETTTEPFERLLEELAAADVRFVLVGGIAVCLHGLVRLTEDMDIVVEATAENAGRLLAVLRQWGEGFGGELEIEDFVPAEVGPIRVGESYILDIFTLMPPPKGGPMLDYAAMRREAITHVLPSGREIHACSLHHLLALKDGTGREKDQLDLHNIRALLEGRADPEAPRLPARKP